MKEYYLAQELITDTYGNTMWTTVGVFEDKAMSLSWLNEDLNKRSIKPVPSMDKTFARMSVEYNRKYEG